MRSGWLALRLVKVGAPRLTEIDKPTNKSHLQIMPVKNQANKMLLRERDEAKATALSAQVAPGVQMKAMSCDFLLPLTPSVKAILQTSGKIAAHKGDKFIRLSHLAQAIQESQIESGQGESAIEAAYSEVKRLEKEALLAEERLSVARALQERLVHESNLEKPK
jgi:hypothetical protein